MKIINNYQCEFCNKSYKNKGLCIRHESDCESNPKQKTCTFCKLRENRSVRLTDSTKYTYKVCLLNHDILSRDKIGCNDFIGSNHLHADLITQHANGFIFKPDEARITALKHFATFRSSIA